MGSGKSSVGRELSKLLCCRFMDLDEVIEASAGRSIPEIFKSDGEAAFRAMELETLKMIINEYTSSTSGDLVLALGGGTVMTPECAGLIHEHTSCIYLRASADTLVSHLEGEAAGRPMLQTPGNSGTQSLSGTPSPDAQALRTRISGLMELRAPVYESVAHTIIDTDGKTLEEIAEISFFYTSGR